MRLIEPTFDERNNENILRRHGKGKFVKSLPPSAYIPAFKTGHVTNPKNIMKNNDTLLKGMERTNS